MNIRTALSALILALGMGLGWHARLRLAAARASHDPIVAEAASRGLIPDRSGTAGASRAPRRERHDREADVRLLAAEFIAFAKEWQSMLEQRGKWDEAMQKRSADFNVRIESLNATQLNALIAVARSINELDGERDCSPCEELLGSAIRALADHNPQAVVALFTGSSGLSKHDRARQIGALHGALYRWAQDAPLAALAWIRDNAGSSPDLVTKPAKDQVMLATAAKDPRLAFKFIGELGLKPRDSIGSIVEEANTPEARTATIDALREYYATITDEKSSGQIPDMDSAGKKSIAEAIANFPITWAVRMLACDAAKEGYESTASWMTTAKLTPADLETFACTLSSGSVKHGETGRWIEWIGATFPRGKTDEGIRSLVGNWTTDDYQAVGKWLDTTPAGSVRDIAVSEYIKTLARYEPASAAQWAMTLPPGAERDATLVLIHDNWPTKTPAAADAAAAFAKQHGLE